jgi:2-hydroxychromene-2-carboxylate isomerase
MTADASAPTRVTVALDVRNPFSYLALGPSFELARALDAEFDWLPLRDKPLSPPTEPGADDDRSIRHRRHRANMLAREIAVYAESQGVTVLEPYRAGSADAANLGWLWIRAHAPEELQAFLAETFRAYWSMELDVSDPQAVAKLVASHGGAADAFLAWSASEGPAALETAIGELAEAGVYATPAYLVGDELFLGRQHLPMIRWLLEGRPGAGPI